MGRGNNREIMRRGESTLVLCEPKRTISEKEKTELAKLPASKAQEEKSKVQPPQLQPEENRPIANLNRLKEFNGLFKSCAKAAQSHQGGRKEARLNQSAERIRLYLIDSLKKAGIHMDWQSSFSDLQATWKMLSDRMWTEREHLNVLQIQGSVRQMTSRLFELPSNGWEELEIVLRNLRDLKFP